MNILVTGGAGFIGSATAARLIADGHNVVVLDNFNQYYDPVLKQTRQEVFLSDAIVIKGDICDSSLVQSVFAEHQFDVVCHFAAQAGVRYSVEVPATYVESNVRGTMVILEAMKQFSVTRMVYASTSSAYGVDTQAPFQESSRADRPVSVYAATKRAAELLAHSYYHQYGIQTTCLRFFTVYGPWSRPDMAMLSFAQKIDAQEPIDIYNNGNLRRDFTYIDDIVEGFSLAVAKPLGYEIINLGNGTPVELLHFVELLERALGTSTSKNLLPMQPGDVFETYADTNKARELLGFTAQTKFADGVQAFADWYRSYVS